MVYTTLPICGGDWESSTRAESCPAVQAGDVSTSALGGASELLVAMRLLEAGRSVARPLVDDAGVDLVVFAPPPCLTVQVKTAHSSSFASYRAGGYSYRAFVFHAQRGWRADFVVFHGRAAEDAWWVVPSGEIRTRGVTITAEGRRVSKWDQYRDAWWQLGV